jgi:glycerophosphoryl diester phosphodiesterase
MYPPEPFAVSEGAVIIAHRGGSLEAPENTVAGVTHGVAVGASWQEIDVCLTADGKVVVIHDDVANRTTTGTGRIDRLSFDELRSFDAGRPRPSANSLQVLKAIGVTPPDFQDRFAGELVPTLSEVLAVSNSRLMIELKDVHDGARLVAGVAADIEAAEAADRVVVGTFNNELLVAFHRHAPDVQLIGIAEHLHELMSHLELPVSVVAVTEELLPDAVRLAPKSVAIWVWTVRDLSSARRIATMGAHGLITDIPGAVVKEFDGSGED